MLAIKQDEEKQLGALDQKSKSQCDAEDNAQKYQDD